MLQIFFYLKNVILRFWPKNCKGWPDNFETFHKEKSGALEKKPRKSKGAHPCAALRSRVGAKGCWRHFFKNPTTQLRVDWVLTEKKCEQTPKFACFSVQRRPLHLSQAEMLPSHAVLKEGIK